MAAFRPGGTVDIGLNHLTLPGDAYFMTDSTYILGRTDEATGRIEVTGKAAIEEGAKVIISGVRTINEDNRYILTANSLTTPHVFQNNVYTLGIIDNDVVILSLNSAKEALEDAVGTWTGNYDKGAALIDQIPAGELKDKLIDIMQKIGLASTPQEAEMALKQLIGESALGAMNAQVDTLAKIGSTLNNHLQSNRSNSRQAPAAGYAGAENRVWAGGFGAWNRQGDRDNVFGYDYNAGGVMLGYERELQNGLTLGLSGSWSSGKLKNNDGLAETDIKTYGLGLYASYEFGGGFFLDGTLGYGYADNKAKINLVPALGGGRKESDFSSNSFTAGLNFGYSAQLAAATYLTPSLGLQYTHIKQNGWQEKIVYDPDKAAIANWFGDSRQNFLEIPLGLKLETTIETNGGIQVSPELRVGGIIAANKPKSELRMGFVGDPSSTTIHGIDPGQSRFTAGAGLKIQLNDTVDVFAGYDLEAKSGYKGHQGTAGIGFSF